jgi:hypothetical protein
MSENGAHHPPAGVPFGPTSWSWRDPAPRPPRTPQGESPTSTSILYNEERLAHHRARVAGIVANQLEWRANSMQRWLDPRRDLDFECGYPGDYIDPRLYQTLYERNHLGGIVVEIFPRECAQVAAQVYEDESPDNDTAWEQRFKEAFDGINGQGQSWNTDVRGSKFDEICLRTDIFAGIGSYCGVLFGIDDGRPLDQPAVMRKRKDKKGDKGKTKDANADGSPVTDLDTTPSTQDSLPSPFNTSRADERPFASNPYSKIAFNPDPADVPPPATVDDPYSVPIPPRKGTPTDPGERNLRFVQIFSETYCRVSEYDTDDNSDRFGLPLRYQITFGNLTGNTTGTAMPTMTREVHWTRVVHVPSDGGFVSNEIRSFPRQQQVLERILDCRKVYGPAAESFFKNGLPTWAFETHPELGSVDFDKASLKDEWEENVNSTTRLIATEGGSLKPLSGQTADPRVQIDIQIEGICMKLGCPVPVFKGYEIGEQASTNNDGDWKNRLRQRRKNYNKTYIVCPIIDRLIALGVLPEPELEDGYKVYYDDEDSQDPQAQATIASTNVTAIATFFNPAATSGPRSWARTTRRRSRSSRTRRRRRSCARRRRRRRP